MIDELNLEHKEFEFEHFNVTATTFDEVADWKPVMLSFAHYVSEPNSGIDCYYDMGLTVEEAKMIIKALQLAVELSSFRG